MWFCKSPHRTTNHARADTHRLYASPKPPPSEIIQDVQACARQLGELENVWSGAARSKEILEQLLHATLYEPSADFGADLFGADIDASFMAGFDSFMDFDQTSAAY